jgi:virginiamycin B lyase
VRLAYDGPLSGYGPHSGAVTQAVASLPPHSARWVTFTLSGLGLGRYSLTLDVDVDDQVAESAECNNQASRDLLVASERQYLPLIFRGTASAGAAMTMVVPPQPAPVEPALAAAPNISGPTVVEFPLPQAGSYPGQLAIDRANGRLWVTERDGNRIARFDLATETWQEYDLSTAGGAREPWGLALDTAGNVWFAETAVDQIGKLDAASGIVTEYGPLAAGSQPWGVALDAAGNVWFTERAGDQIGKLDPATGIPTEYGVLPPGSHPGGIAAYGDYVWFAETGTNLLGMFQISKEVLREFHTMPPYEEPLIAPEDVTVISGGNPWLTNTGGNGIALFRFSTTQNFHTIGVPTADSEPYGITTGGTNSIWFTERAGNKIGRYGPQDAVIEYSLPTPGSQPTDVVVDGQGCAWYAAPGSNRIGRVCRTYTYLPLVSR